MSIETDSAKLDLPRELDAFNYAIKELGVAAIRSKLPPIVVLTGTMIDMAILLEYECAELKDYLCERIDLLWIERSAELRK